MGGGNRRITKDCPRRSARRRGLQGLCRGARTAADERYAWETQTDDGLSWEAAQEEAGKWLGSFHLGRDLTGRRIDLTHAELPFEGTFRNMVLEAVRRKLKKRGAREIALPPPAAE